jgi:hypothetical protein
MFVHDETGLADADRPMVLHRALLVLLAGVWHGHFAGVVAELVDALE